MAPASSIDPEPVPALDAAAWAAVLLPTNLFLGCLGAGAGLCSCSISAAMPRSTWARSSSIFLRWWGDEELNGERAVGEVHNARKDSSQQASPETKRRHHVHVRRKILPYLIKVRRSPNGDCGQKSHRRASNWQPRTGSGSLVQVRSRGGTCCGRETAVPNAASAGDQSWASTAPGAQTSQKKSPAHRKLDFGLAFAQAVETSSLRLHFH